MTDEPVDGAAAPVDHRVRTAWLVLVVLALGLSIAYGVTRGGGSSSAGPLPSPTELPIPVQIAQQVAALDPCPTGLDLDVEADLACLGGGPPVRLQARGTGVPTLVNLYGSWCGPCLEEMPLLVALRAKAGDRLRIVGVDTKDDPLAALQFAHDLDQHWPAVVDEDGVVLRRYGGNGVPRTLFLDADGELAHLKAGPFRSAEELEGLVREHLGVAL